jgi:hypothetical protein
MATKKKPKAGVKEVSDWVTQADAAAKRGVHVNVVNNWLARGRLKHTREMYGRRLVSLSEVMSYEPSKGGRPSTKKGGKR